MPSVADNIYAQALSILNAKIDWLQAGLGAITPSSIAAASTVKATRDKIANAWRAASSDADKARIASAMGRFAQVVQDTFFDANGSPKGSITDEIRAVYLDEAKKAVDALPSVGSIGLIVGGLVAAIAAAVILPPLLAGRRR